MNGAVQRALMGTEQKFKFIASTLAPSHTCLFSIKVFVLSAMMILKDVIAKWLLVGGTQDILM